MKCNNAIQQSGITAFSLAVFLFSTVGWADKLDDWRDADDYRELTAEQKKLWDEAYDRRDIRYEAGVQTDKSDRFIRLPEHARNADRLRELKANGKFEIAEAPPRIDFAIVQNLEPRYLDADWEVDRATPVWGGWGEVNLGPDGAFYFAYGNHIAYGADAHILRYDPREQKQSSLLSARQTIGWTDEDYGDSKLHGHLHMNPDGEMWLLTFNSPSPTEEERKTVYRGGWLLRTNIFTEETENLGIPLEGSSWPYHAWDWERGFLFGVDRQSSRVLVYNTEEREMHYGGAPPDGIRWRSRCTMLDRETGYFYSTHVPEDWERKDPDKEDEHRFVRYKTRNNRFERMEAVTPPNPTTGVSGPIRAHTSRKTSEGAFWCFDHYGTLFKFYPEEDRTEVVDVNWPPAGRYVASLAMSPGERYLYYVLDSSTWGDNVGTPVVQYDTETNTHKVLAFLLEYYQEAYGYAPGGTYGVELCEKGESLFFYVNGWFTPDYSGRYGRPAFFHLHIPESEREEM